MWYHASAMQPLLNLCKTADITEKSGIHISKNIANRTVWDTFAIEHPDHPAISPTDEAIDASKSITQINHIKQYVTDSTVLLDYGCGYGRVAQYLLPKVTLTGYIGLDSSYELLKLFRERYDKSETEQTTPLLLLNADTNSPPLNNNSVDVAVVAVVFRHNHKSVVKQSVAELARVVQPGGTVLVYSAFPRMVSLMGIQGQLYQIILNLLGRPFKNGPVRYYTQGEIKRLFRDFSSVELVPVGYNVLPHSIIILPRPLQVVWRKVIANPANTLLERLTPTPLRRYFATHIDVIAKR